MPTSTEINPHDIETSLAKVRDQKTFLNDLLAETLNWPVQTGVEEIDAITYEWSQEDLRSRDLDKKLIAGRVLQVQLTTKQPWGIFILEFAGDEVFKTDRGMTGILRQVLRGLVKNRNKPDGLPSWQRENLLFICTHAYKHFRVAHFKAPKEDGRTARLAAFGWGPDIPARTACTFNLNHLGWPSTTAGFDEWAEAFNVEKVTKKFYREYSDEFEALRKAVKGLGADTEDQKMFTQTLLNRLMFLRFIERKDWLTPPGGEDSKDYLKLLFAACNYRGKSFYNGRLRKLFFEGLAVDGKQESEAIGKAVFLNGGLFEENKLDEKIADIPNEAFAPLLGEDGLFYRYNFTVQESTPLDVEVAVDPEMLGKVFEELVTGRHEQGAYAEMDATTGGAWLGTAHEYAEEFPKPKIIYPQIMVRPQFTFDPTGTYTNQKCFIICSEDRYLLSILNSSTAWEFVRENSPLLRGGYSEPRRELISSLPIPDASASDRKAIGASAQKCLDAVGVGCEAWEKEIDERVVALYGL